MGFVFTEDDPFAGIDLDSPVNAEERERHSKIFQAFTSYAEYSLSGNGLHIIVKGEIPHAVKRDHVEVYDRGRYFIMTGKHLEGTPTTIEDHNELLNTLIAEMGKPRAAMLDHSEPQRESDDDVLRRCHDSANGAKFYALWQGQWQGGYSSQSEADYALVNILAFASRNNDQVKRLFRKSALGHRDKAMRVDYMDDMLGSIRAEQNPPIDFTNFEGPNLVEEDPPSPAAKFDSSQFPEGLVGEMAHYIYDTAIRPVPQIALAGGLGLMAGIGGRAYNISHTGLNLYLLLIAGTAIGKEGAAQGIDRIVKATAAKLPAVHQYMGPTEYASGQALVKQLAKTPCMISVLGEFGHTIRTICSPNAIGADIMWRKMLLHLYNKSGHNDVLGSMVYSDAGKNTPIVNSPAFTLLAESTASSLFEGLTEQAIEIGLIPRFLLIECHSKRPPLNHNAFTMPGEGLVSRVEAIAHRCLSMEANDTYQPILLSREAEQILADFDVEVDRHINAQDDDCIRQIWSRAHMKALRVAGVITLGMDPDKPLVQAREAEWGIEFVRQDARNMLSRFGAGVGRGDTVQLSRLRQIILNTLRADGHPRLMKQHSVVTHRQLTQRAYALTCFREDRMGAGNALKRGLQALIDNGELLQLSATDTRQHFNTTAKCYMATDSFQGED
jgi:hypothetical protein